MHKLVNLLERVLNVTIGVALAVMLGLILWQVVLRYIFSDGLIWGEDLARIMMIYAALIGAAVAHHRGKHIRFDLLDRILPEWMKRVFKVVAELAVLLTASTLAYYGWYLMSENAFQESLTLGISMLYIYSILPLGLGLIALASLGRLIALIQDGLGAAG